MKIRIVCSLALIVACHDEASSPSPPKGVAVATVDVSSAAFASGGPIAVGNTCDGSNQSPQVGWSAMPDKVQSIAIVFDDPDAPSGKFTHWMVWNVTKDTRQIGAGGNGGLGGGVAGTNDFGDVGYGGPCPPKGALHHYHLRVYGLDTKLTLRVQAKRGELDSALAGHVLAQGETVGTFQH